MIEAQKKNLDKAKWYFEEPVKRISVRQLKFRIEAYMNLANIYLATNKLVEAEDAYKKALESDKRNLQVLGALARLYEGWKKNINAVEVYKDILNIQPGNVNVQNKLKKLAAR